MATFIYGSKEKLKRRREIADIVANEPVFSRRSRIGLTGIEDVKHGLRMSRRYFELCEKFKLNKDDAAVLLELIDDPLPCYVHESAFTPVIYSLGTDEQAKYWGSLAEKQQILGCYAQTELGHGSNLSSLETTATFDKSTDEWIIHSPTFTSTKWWIGGAGVLATHAFVQAHLIIDGKDYGTHGFIVPIRSLENHRPFPSVKAGYIGPKSYGGASKSDMGFLRFEHHRIPRENMLMRFAKVTKEGEYIKPPSSKLAYGSMVLLRSYLVQTAALTLARAATIATRYSTVRRQFHERTARHDEAHPTLETQIIHYPMVQARLYPIIAQTYAMIAAGNSMIQLYQRMLKKQMKGDISSLTEVHAISSGLKSTCTTIAAVGTEECRKLMGGHGYSYFSGISNIWSSFIPTNTFEGDNFLLTQQTARYLLKQLKAAATNPDEVTPYSKYLLHLVNLDSFRAERCSVQTEDDWLDQRVQVAAFEHRAARLASELAQAATKPGVLWSDLNVDCWRLTHAHSQYIMVRSFTEAIASAALTRESGDGLKASTVAIMKVLADLFALHTIEQNLGDFLEDQYLSPRQCQALRSQIKRILQGSALADNAVALTDAFDFSDHYLGSALGAYDGNAYRRLWEAALEDPINQQGIKGGYEEYIRPILTQHGKPKL
ncbi:hypothetical protein BGW41_001102 [Actinomortierella wolfii]|nr:hypothetical protein BGW41_001102 [Actinomortierella wolfii]